MSKAKDTFEAWVLGGNKIMRRGYLVEVLGALKESRDQIPGDVAKAFTDAGLFLRSWTPDGAAAYVDPPVTFGDAVALVEICIANLPANPSYTFDEAVMGDVRAMIYGKSSEEKQP